MKYLLLVLGVFFLFISPVYAQTPGGVTGGNTLWLRSDIGVTSTSSNVTQWQDISGAGVTGDFTLQNIPGTSTAQTSPLLLNVAINFNPYLRFNGSTSSLTSLNNFTGNLLVSNTEVTVLQVFNLKAGVVWFKWETDQLGSSGRLGFENSSGKIRFDFPKAVPSTAGQNIGNVNVLNVHSLSTAYASASASVNRLNGADDNTIPLASPGNFSSAASKACIGNDYVLNLPAQIDIAEIIIFSRALSPAERNKVESYLAVKYGFTLSQLPANANNYVASDASIIWNTANNSAFANDITGIGRDDASGLLQKQSKSLNTSSLVTLVNGSYPTGNFPAANAGNTNSFAADKTFLLIGDNGTSATPDQCIYNGKGQRMQRIWKVSNQNMSSPVTFSLRQALVAPSIKNMIVSTDPTFPPASTAMYPLTAANGYLFANLALNHNDYFSFSTDTLIVNLSVSNPTCANPNSASVTSTITGNNSPLTYSWNPTGQTTPALTNVPAGNYILTVTQGTCQSTYQANIAATPAPSAPVVNNATACAGNTATLAVQSPNASYTYNWYNAAVGGVPIGTGTSFTTAPLSSSTTYYVDAGNGTCTGPRTTVTITVITVNAPVVNNATICAGAAATLSVQSPVTGEVYQWFASATGGSVLASGNSYTTPVLNSNTTYYVEAANGTCIGPRTAVTVTVNSTNAPAVNNATVCSGSTVILNIQNPNAAYTYNWYAAASGGTVLFSGVSYTTPPLSSTTVYYAEAVSNGCISIRTAATATVITIPVPTVNAVAVCPGTSATLTIQNPNATYIYNWYNSATGGTSLFTGTAYTTPPIISNSIFYAEASDGTCTGVRTAVSVTILPALDTPQVHVTGATAQSVSFSWPPVTGAVDYLISFNGNAYQSLGSASSLTYTVTNLQPSQSVTLSVIAVSGPTGCGDSDPGQATGTTGGNGFYVPAAFTPNGDHKNDLLSPRLPGGATLNYFTVWNRWGQKIFSLTTSANGWDGNWQAKEQPTGAYIWMCRYRDISGKVINMQGTVMLLR